MVDKMLNLLQDYDTTLFQKFAGYCKESNHKKSLGIVLRKFVQSLGFYLVNIDVCLYIWDQIILKTEPQKDEMYYYFVGVVISAKDELLQCVKFSDFVEVMYFKGKAVSKDLFVAKYLEMIPKMQYFVPRYDYDQVPVEDIRLNKFPMDQRVSSKIQKQIDAERDDLSLDEDEKKVRANMEQLIRQNVINEDHSQFPEGDGMLVDNSVLKNINKPKPKHTTDNVDDILADLGGSKKSRNDSRKKESRKTDKSKRKTSSKPSEKPPKDPKGKIQKAEAPAEKARSRSIKQKDEKKKRASSRAQSKGKSAKIKEKVKEVKKSSKSKPRK